MLCQQQEKQHTTRKASIKQQQKMAKTAQKATTTVHTFWKVKSGKGVFFTQQQEQGGPNAEEGGKPRQIKAKRCGAPKGGGGEGRREEPR